MKKTLLFVILVSVLTLGLAACSAGGTGTNGSKPSGLPKAYEKLQAADIEGRFEAVYDETADSLSLTLGGSESTIDEVFDIIDETTAGTDVGTIDVYIEWGWVRDTAIASVKEERSQAMLPVLSKRIGNLECNSLERLTVGRFINDLAEAKLYDDTWTNALQKTDILNIGFWGNTYSFKNYSAEGLENLETVKRLELGNRYEGGAFEYLPNVEELVFSSGDDEDDKADTTRKGLTWKNTYRDRADNLVDFAALKRIVFFPDLETWKTNNDYYEFIMAVQASRPDMLTNEPGTGWDGNEESLIAVADIDVRGALGDKNYEAAKKDMLKVAAKSAFMEGQEFKAASGQPKLDGPTLVYRMSTPYELEWSDYSVFSSNGNVLLDEFDGTKVTPPTETFQFDYLVYAYPMFEEVGVYESGTIACATIVYAQVYDLKNKVRYDPVEIDEIQPPESRILDNDKRYAAEVEDGPIVSYVTSLAG